MSKVFKLGAAGLTAVAAMCIALPLSFITSEQLFVYGAENNTVISDTAINGDVNNDGSLSISDAVMLQKWLLNVPDAKLTDWKAGDLCHDDKINVFDLCLLKRLLIAGAVTPPTDPETDNTVTAVVYDNNRVMLYNASGEVITEPTNVSLNGTTVTVNLPSVIDVSGTSDTAQLIVDVDKTAYAEGVVELALKGADLSNSVTSPIYVAQIGDVVEISAKNGYDNIISDGTNYTNADGDMGAIYACDDLKIKGKGNLTVNGNGGDGIVCKNDLKIYNGNITVNAVDDGIRGKDSVTIGDADDTDFSKLNVTINAASDGIKSTEDNDTSDGYVTINGGTVSVNAGDDGIHAITNLTINNGTLNIEKCVEGLEAAKIYINGGDVFMKASDDGINATVGAEIECYNGEALIHITGGKTEIITKGDALDSNGDILIEGGDILCHGPGNSIFGYGALDYVNKAEITGGRFIAFTSSGKAFSDTSTQPSFNLNFSSMMEKAEFELTDNSGNILVSETALLPADCIIVSIPELVVGETYTAKAGDITTTVRQRDIVIKTKASE